MFLRQGLSQNFEAVLSGTTQSTISKRFNACLDALNDKLVPLHLGSSAFSTQSIKESTPRMWRDIWPGTFGAIDGTYIYTQKSSVFNVQRKAWNG